MEEHTEVISRQSNEMKTQEKVIKMLNDLGLNVVKGEPHLQRPDASMIIDLKFEKEIKLK